MVQKKKKIMARQENILMVQNRQQDSVQSLWHRMVRQQENIRFLRHMAKKWHGMVRQQENFRFLWHMAWSGQTARKHPILITRCSLNVWPINERWVCDDSPVKGETVSKNHHNPNRPKSPTCSRASLRHKRVLLVYITDTEIWFSTACNTTISMNAYKSIPVNLYSLPV